MAKYGRSADGDNADNGSTWALAKATASGLAAVGSVGEDLYLAQGHAESSTSTQSITFAAEARLICANDGAEPPTASATTALIEVTGSGIGINVAGVAYIHGIEFRAGSGTLAYSILLGVVAADLQHYKSCKFRGNSTAGSPQAITIGTNTNGVGSHVHWSECDLQFAQASHRFFVRNGFFEWEGGAVIAGAALTGPLFSLGATGRGGSVRISGVDFSACSASLIFTEAPHGTNRFTLSNCKLPSGWSGDLFSGIPVPSFRPSMYNCDDGDTNYRMRIKDNAGNIRDETTIVRTGGATDGVTPISWKMESNDNTTISNRLLSDPIATFNDTVGSPITFTVEIIADGVTLTNADMALGVEYGGTSGFPLSRFASDSVAGDNSNNVLATAANQATSTEAWTTTGLTSPVKQKLSVTVTPLEKGVIYLTARLTRPNTTVYVCPKVSAA